MFKVDNVGAFAKGIFEFEKGLDRAVGEVYRGWSIRIFHDLVKKTPQWTGNAAANWNYSVDKIDVSFDTHLLDEAESMAAVGATAKPLRAGNVEARRYAAMANSGRENKVTVSKAGSLPTIFIANASRNLSGQAYTQKLEDNPNGFLRTVNEPGHMVARVVAKFGNKGILSHQERLYYRSARI